MLFLTIHAPLPYPAGTGAFALRGVTPINLPLILSIQDTSFSELERKGILFRSRRIKERLELVKLILIEGPDPYVRSQKTIARRQLELSTE